jgi:hypothetical protein
MAKFEDHCKDCERILGSKREDVNRWMDELFKQYGPRHRRHRHCWYGVREALKLFGIEGAKAAVIHIVRDCGEVPSQRTYDELGGIVLAPSFLIYDDLDEKAFESFTQVVNQEFEKAAGVIGKEWLQQP